MEFKVGDVVLCRQRHGEKLLFISKLDLNAAQLMFLGTKEYAGFNFLKDLELAAKPGEKKARKDDSGKPRFDILFSVRGLDDIAAVFTSGGKKYGDDFNWRKSAGSDSGSFRNRLLAATLRHLYRHCTGEKLDKQSGKPHLAHACANILMIMDLENTNE